ncbi:MAG: MFS transporter [Deltaproteobacteria bacterium]|nr:MFS transporter [Deltaproteobacteria bacterium]MCB9786366.1 MFS transporter [Deltaproteobacteria bacterium]
MSSLRKVVEELEPIVILLVVVAIVIGRLPRVQLGHSDAFRRRRVLNWLPLGLTYAFLYMGRYNLTVSKNALGSLMPKEDFGTIFFWGTLVYGVSFVINGPLTDRIGGRRTIMISAIGAALMNILMGVTVWAILTGRYAPSHLVVTFSILYALNMYFQSFGAVSIVKVNASWFHVSERGVFGAIFGVLISLGVYFAYDGGRIIVEAAQGSVAGIEGAVAPFWWVFYIPAGLLLFFALLDFFFVRDTPGDAGQRDFDTADASSGDTGPRLGVFEVARRMFTNPVIVTIAAIEFCSGFLRNAIMQWYIIFAKETHIMESFVPHHWGMLLCCAGILGGTIAGIISDRVFQSRRGPVAGMLYAGMLAGAAVLIGILTTPVVGWLMVFMSLCIIGVHGMLSGTASMDFGGRRNVGVAVGIIDGLVYLGTAAQAIIYGQVLPKGEAGQDPANWWMWPVIMVPVAGVGLLLALRIWNAKPQPRAKAGAH